MNPSILAIGIDAAEATLVRRLIDEGRLPALARLATQGTWSVVRSSADVGSGSVWPTFMTGQDPLQHGIHAHWSWRPQAMVPGPCDRSGLRPFWRDLDAAGISVGVLDVPFSQTGTLRHGWEITEWHAHDALDGQMSVEPPDLAEMARAHAQAFSGPLPPGPATAESDSIDAFVGRCRAGVRARAQLTVDLMRERPVACALIVFTEAHHASHCLWPRLDARDGQPPRAAEGLVKIYEEVDRAVAVLLDAAPVASVLVFSLHGFRRANGVAAFLGPMLRERGFSAAPAWRSQSWVERAASVLGAAKRRSPPWLKSLYHGVMPESAVRQVAQATLFPPFDWDRTRAFAWPTDQHGWIRVNLKGREARGCVDPDRFDDTCREITAWLESLTDRAGRPLTERVVRTAPTADAARASALPDLVAHWTDAALASPLEIRGSSQVWRTDGARQSGQHALDGFCVWHGPAELAPPAVVPSTDLHRLIANAATHR